MDELAEKTVNEGIFLASLKRNNKQIKDDRAQSIYEDVEMAYKRTIEDMEHAIKRLHRNAEAMLDLSGDSTTTLLLKDLDPVAFVQADSRIADEIRNMRIQLNIRKDRYNKLFGYTYLIEGAI